MIVLGLHGGISMPYEHVPNMAQGQNHDAAAALLVDGEIVSAIEEERLNRIKHTNKFPSQAIKTVLCDGGLSLDDVDLFCCSTSEAFFETIVRNSYYIDSTQADLLSPRDFMASLFKKAFDFDLDTNKICFVDHHMAHAASSFYLSGFDKSLIVTLDGVGESVSSRVLYGNKHEMKPIQSLPEINSLGHYYVWVSKFIGYDQFDEYKVNGAGAVRESCEVQGTFFQLLQTAAAGKIRDLPEFYSIFAVRYRHSATKGSAIRSVAHGCCSLAAGIYRDNHSAYPEILCRKIRF